MYLDTECTTTSAPNRRGDYRYGDKNVLSATTIISLLNSWAISERTLISETLRVGLVGVSIHKSLVLLFNAFCTFSGLVVSTKSTST